MIIKIQTAKKRCIIISRCQLSGRGTLVFEFRRELLDMGTWEEYMEPDDQGG